MSTQVDVEFRDVSMRDKISRSRRAELTDGRVIEERELQPIPEDLMGKLDGLSGDGRGRVTVGAELSSSTNFGFKAGAFVNITVTCDSSVEVCEEVHEIIQPSVERLVVEDHARVSNIRADLLPVFGEKSHAILETGGKVVDPPSPRPPGKVGKKPMAKPRARPKFGR